jgi:hypothetical protein
MKGILMLATSCRWRSELAAVLAVVLAFAFRTALADPAPGVTFTRIADTSTIIPAGQWAGEKFYGFGIPSIQNGRVAFVGAPETTNGTENGVYTWSNGALVLLADPSVPRPGGGPAFDRFRYPSANGDEYAFDTGSSLGRTNGIYRMVNGTLTSIGELPVTHTDGTTFDNDDTWFYGYSFHPPPIGGIINSGIYRARDGSIENVVPDGTPTPSAPEGYGFYFVSIEHRVVAHDGSAVFWAVSKKPSSPDISGLYRVKDGVVERIVDSSMAAPGGSGTFGPFTPYSTFDDDGGALIFKSGGRVYTERDGVFTLIASGGEPAPGGGVFAFHTYADVSVDAGRIVFSGGPDPLGYPSNLYINDAESLHRIIAAGDELSGKIVQKVQIGPQGLSGNEVVFWARFTDLSYGIYLVTIPEPTSGLPVLIAVAIISRVANRKEAKR